MVCLMKELFCFSHDFQTWFYDADNLLYYAQMPQSSFHTSVVLLHQFLRNGKWKEY